MSSTVLTDRTWRSVAAEYADSEPSHVVLDDFLSPAAYAELHEFLLHHPGWTFNSAQAQSRYLARPHAPQADEIARSLASCIPDLLSGLQLVEHWAFLHPRSAGLRPHFDAGSVTLNLWMTADQHNRTPERNGLVLYRVRRPAAPPPELTTNPGWSDDYFRRLYDGNEVRVPYRCNRAVIFPSPLYHASDEGEFEAFDLRSSRMNLTFLFDDPMAYDSRRERFGYG